MQVDYSKEIDRSNTNDCYCLNGISPVSTEESITCCVCGYVSEAIYSCYEDSTDTTMQTYSGNYEDSLFSQSFNMRTTTIGNYASKKMLWMNMTYSDTVILDIKRLIEEKELQLCLSKCMITTALHYFKKFIEYKDANGNKSIFKGANRIAIVAVCLFFSCRETDSVNYTHSDICNAFGVEKKIFDIHVSLFHKRVSYKKDVEMKFEDIIKNTCSKVNISIKHLNLCLNIGITIEKFGILSEIPYIKKAIGILFFVMTETNIPFDRAELTKTFEIKNIFVNKIVKTLNDNKNDIFSYIKTIKK